MAQAHIFQIYYSEQTRRTLDSGFIPLDNMTNERPDWREYWPIRNFLLNHPLNEDDYYGFFSPKFKEKTGLSAVEVKDFISSCREDVDVVIFSRMFDLCAPSINIFEQGEMHHAGLIELFQEFLDVTNQDIRLSDLVNDSSDMIFCNYFAARPKFWQAWFALTEQLFSLTENSSLPLSGRLNSGTAHDGGLAPMKVFILERMATLMLSTQSVWRAVAADPFAMRPSTPFQQYFLDFIVCDALKSAYKRRGYPVYKDEFFKRVAGISESILSERQSRQADKLKADGGRILQQYDMDDGVASDEPRIGSPIDAARRWRYLFSMLFKR